MGAETSIPGELAVLSERQREVFALVGAGLSNAQVAARLFVSEETVRTHLRNIRIKLGLRNRVQVAVYAVQLGVATDASAHGGVLGIPGPRPMSQSARRSADPRACRTAGLSARAQQVAAMIVTGATNVEIAQELGLGVETVKSHVSCILRKLDVCNRAEIAARVAAAEMRRTHGVLVASNVHDASN